MQVLLGKTQHTIDLPDLLDWTAAYDDVVLDLGTGDGVFVRHLANRAPRTAVIGIDTCATNARANSRNAPQNARFVVHDALSLPPELAGLASRITINFPWGSLLRALLDGDERLLSSLSTCPCTIHVNAGALAEQGYDFDQGIEAIRRSLRSMSPRQLTIRHLDRRELRSVPTTWSKRLAFGRDPRAIEINSKPGIEIPG